MMSAAEYISGVDDFVVPFLPSHPHHSEMEKERDGLCFICDSVTNNESVKLQFGQTTHSKTGLPIKLGQLIGDDFMVIVSVNDRLCFACIKLINLADKLEIELNIVKKVITGHLKSKYQLSDESDVSELISVSKNDVCDMLVNNSSFEVTEGSEVNVGVEMHDELLNDFNKTDCQTEEMCVVNESDSDVEIIEEASNEKTNEFINSSVKISSTSSSPPSSLLKQSAVGSCHNSFTIKDAIKEDSGNVKIAENKSNLLLNNNSNDVINVDGKNTINNNIQIKKEIICDRIISDKNSNKLKANKCSVNRPVFKCTMCDDAFHTQVLLRKHIMNSHLNKWSCYFCSITFNNDSEYQKHMKIHIKNVKLQSQLNSDKNLSESNFSDNGNNSSLDFDNQNEVKTFFKCKNCKFKTKFNFLLDKHQFECCATNSSASSSSTSLNDIKNKNVIKCQSCLTIFKNKKQLNLHVCSAANNNNNNNTNNTDDSNNCSDRCVTSNNTYENKCSKSCKYKCGICSLTFNIKNSLIKHLRSHKISNINKTNNTLQSSTKLCNKILDYSTTKDDSTTEIIQVDVDLNTNDYDNDVGEIHLNDDDDDDGDDNDDCDDNDVDNIDENMATNTLLLRCGICSLTFDKQSTYIEHINFHKNNNKKIITNNESAPEIYFDNVEHFMALSSESSSINLSSDKENSLNLNYNINKNITDISLTDKKTDHCDGANDDDNDNNDDIDNENDHDNKINLITNLSCSTCNVSFNSKNDLDKHAILYDHKLHQNFNDFKYNNLIKTDNNGIDNKHFINNDTNKILDNKNNISIIESQFVNEIIINTLNTSVQNNSSNNHCCVNKSISNDVSSSNITSLSGQQCTYTGTPVNDLKDHENIDHNLLNDMITCNICDKYIDKNNENEHYNSHKTIYCNYCSFETKNKKLMSKHIKEHNNKNNNRKDRQDYLCQYCSETFKTKKLLKSHEELHPENFEFHCNECNKKFMKEKQLKNHYDEVHRDPHCYYCGKEIFNLKALKNHEQRHVRDLHNSNKLECDICKRVFKTRTGLRHHFAIHTGKFKYFCDFCQRGFMSRMMLEEHRSCHTKEDRYVCDVCGRKFTFQSTYWIHRKWHDNPFPYKCNFCGRLFRHTSLLAVHKRKHTGERPYKCPHCPLSFTVGGTLKRHLILHTQKFPFTCDTCKRGFTTKHKYSVHLAKMHNNYELLNNKKSLQKQTDFKMVIKEKSVTSPRNTDVSTENEKLSTTSREPPDNFEFIPDTTNFTLVNMEEDDTGNSAVMMPCIMTTVNNEENNGLVFEIISGSPLQQMSSGIALPENTMLPDMWCQ